MLSDASVTYVERVSRPGMHFRATKLQGIRDILLLNDLNGLKLFSKYRPIINDKDMILIFELEGFIANRVKTFLMKCLGGERRRSFGEY